MYKFDMEIKDEVKYKYKVSRIFFFFNPNFNHIPAFFISPPPTKCSDFSFPHYFFFSFFCLKLGLKSAYFSMGQCRKWLRLFFTYPKEFSFPGEIISYLTWNVTVCLIYPLSLHRKANTFISLEILPTKIHPRSDTDRSGGILSELKRLGYFHPKNRFSARSTEDLHWV